MTFGRHEYLKCATCKTVRPVDSDLEACICGEEGVWWVRIPKTLSFRRLMGNDRIMDAVMDAERYHNQVTENFFFSAKEFHERTH